MTKDVIIVLGGGVNPDGILPAVPKLRVAKGVELFKQGLAPRILFSGKWGYRADYVPIKTEAQAMKEYALELGVSEEAVLKEEDSVDTIGNAYFCKVNFLEPNNWRKIAVVTSEYHLERVRFIFERVLGPKFEVEYLPVDSQLSPEELAKRIERGKKTIGLLTKWIKTVSPGDTEEIGHLLFTKHPGYAVNSEISKEKLIKMLNE